MVPWIALVNLKEIKKARQIFGISAKNKLTFEFFTKFLNLHSKFSMENWFFLHFLSYLPGPLSFYTALKIAPFFLDNFSVSREISPSPLWGRPWILSQVRFKKLELTRIIVNWIRIKHRQFLTNFPSISLSFWFPVIKINTAQSNFHSKAFSPLPFHHFIFEKFPLLLKIRKSLLITLIPQ